MANILGFTVFVFDFLIEILAAFIVWTFPFCAERFSRLFRIRCIFAKNLQIAEMFNSNYVTHFVVILHLH